MAVDEYGNPIDEVEESSELAPFTLDDAEDELKACALCAYHPNCAIIAFVNKLSIKRDGKAADDDFSCTIFKEAN